MSIELARPIMADDSVVELIDPCTLATHKNCLCRERFDSPFDIHTNTPYSLQHTHHRNTPPPLAQNAPNPNHLRLPKRRHHLPP
jgi:hypothetical protein